MCILIPGCWKTHNELLGGGAPEDPTWYLLGDVDGDGTPDDAAALLDEYDGSEAGKNPDIKGKDAKPIRAQFVSLAGTLGSFNAGTFLGLLPLGIGAFRRPRSKA